MKNRYVTKLLCVTLMSAMILNSSFGVMAGAVDVTPETKTETSSPDISETPDGETPDGETPPPESPSPTPTGTPTPTPTPTGTPTPTPTPTESPSPTPTGTPTPTPTPTRPPEPSVNQAAVNRTIQLINAIGTVTLESEGVISVAREAYNSLTSQERALVTNYGVLTAAEAKLTDLMKNQKPEDPKDEPVDGGNGGGDSGNNGDNGSSAVTGDVIRYRGSSSTSNIHAGRTFYLDQLQETYKLTFDDDFEDVMDAVEKEYKEKNKIGETTELYVRNWQDILAIYVLRETQAGEKEFVLDKASKKKLAAIFEELNPVVRDKKSILLVSYGDLKVADYIKNQDERLDKKELKLLDKYTNSDCAILCSTVTAAKGFIRDSAGDDISEERVDVLAAAYSLVGKVGYFWGGKSNVIGWDSSWGTAATVSSGGSRSSGSVRSYGLDCSGFITWAVINGYDDTGMENTIGHGTSAQWENCDTIDAAEAQPGDLVFQRGPEGGSDNHVGFLAGQTEEGDWIAVHCSSGQNGVVVGEAYSASFRYIRRPTFFPTKEEELARREKLEKEAIQESLALKGTDEESEDKKSGGITDNTSKETASNSITEAIKADEN